MTDKTTLKDSTKIEDVNVIAREAIAKTVNTMGTSVNVIFIESIIFESTKGTQKTIYEIMKEKKLKNWSTLKGAVSRACNSALGAIALLQEAGAYGDILEGSHNERLKKIESVLKDKKISMRKSYDKFKKMNAPEEEDTTEQQPAEQQPAEQQPAEQQPAEQQPAEQQPAELVTIPSERFNEELILLTQKYEEDLSAVEIFKILESQMIFYKNKLTPRQLKKLEKIA